MSQPPPRITSTPQTYLLIDERGTGSVHRMPLGKVHEHRAVLPWMRDTFIMPTTVPYSRTRVELETPNLISSADDHPQGQPRVMCNDNLEPA